jgi:hypothetical protein
MEGNSQSAKGSSIMENLKLTGRFLQTLITIAADVVDENPAKVVLGLATAILNIKDVSLRTSDRTLTDYHLRWWEATRILSYSG